MIFWRKDKYNIKLYIVDELLTLVAMNTACFINQDSTKLMHALIICSLYGIFLIKTYYVITAFILYRQSIKQ